MGLPAWEGTQKFDADPQPPKKGRQKTFSRRFWRAANALHRKVLGEVAAKTSRREAYLGLFDFPI